MESTSYIFTPFVAKRSGTQRLIQGPISANMVDLDGQLVDQEWLKSALPAWFQFGNIREQHNPQRAVGKAQTLDLDHDTGPFITAKISDDDTWRKIEDGVYSGFSIGVKSARIAYDGRAPKGTICGGEVIEVSVVDHPSARKAAFTLATKVAGGWKDIQSGTTITTEDDSMDATKSTNTDPADDDSVEDKERDERDKDNDALGHKDFECDKCGEDARYCDCYRESVSKAPAADFESEHDNPRPINPGHPSVKGGTNTLHASDATHSHGDQGADGGLSDSDATVHMDYAKKQLESLVSRFESALTKLNGAGFNPNNGGTDDYTRVGSGDPAHDMGATPDDKQAWHGSTATHANAEKKGVDVADIEKIASDAARIAIETLIADTEIILTKGAAPANSTQASLVDLIKRVASDIAYEAFDQVEARLVKVENTPLPAKGYAATPIDTRWNLTNPLERQIAEQEVTNKVAGMSDDERIRLTAQMISNQWRAGQSQ